MSVSSRIGSFGSSGCAQRREPDCRTQSLRELVATAVIVWSIRRFGTARWVTMPGPLVARLGINEKTPQPEALSVRITQE
jgi:hypothetical protein